MAESEECRRAFQASLELLKEKCSLSFESGGKIVRLEEVGAITIPEEVEKIASSNPELTREQRVKAISEIGWARNWAAGMCRLVSPELGAEEREACIDRLARNLAERVV